MPVEVHGFRLSGMIADETNDGSGEFTDLYYNGYRYYDPFLGRYAKPDPINPSMVNAVRKMLTENPGMPALVTESQLIAARMGLGLPVVVRDVMTINNITLYKIAHADYLAIVEHALVSMPNGYVYVHNNPVSWVDPWGLDLLNFGLDVPVIPGVFGYSMNIIWTGGEEFHLSFGLGFVPNISLAITGSSQDVVPGFYKVIQGGYGSGGQFGFDQNNEPCWEIGMVTPGGSATVGFITPSMTVDDIINGYKSIRKRQKQERKK